MPNHLGYCGGQENEVLLEHAADNRPVDRQPLVTADGKLALGEPRAEPVQRALLGKGFVDDVVAGDWISIHWGWACEVLDGRRRTNLERYTRYHLGIANQTV